MIPMVQLETFQKSSWFHSLFINYIHIVWLATDEDGMLSSLLLSQAIFFIIIIIIIASWSF